MKTLLILGRSDDYDIIFCPFCCRKIKYYHIDQNKTMIFCPNYHCRAKYMIICIPADYGSNCEFLFNYNKLTGCFRELFDREIFDFAQVRGFNVLDLKIESCIKFYSISIMEILFIADASSEDLPALSFESGTTEIKAKCPNCDSHKTIKL